MTSALALLEAMRPRQWSKNLFVFAGLIFAGQIGHLPSVLTAVAAFVCFCLISSAIYLVNDTADRNRDLMHPQKRNRPIASGRLPVPRALAAFAVLSAVGLTGGFALTAGFGGICLIYWALMIVYTYWLKHEVILDVFVIAAGFVLRALGGAVVISVPISDWLIICTILLALFMALGKRRAELVTTDNGREHRKALKEYSVDYIDQMISVVTAATVISYMFYAFQSGTAAKQHNMILTIPFVLYGIFRYLYLVYCKDQGGNPEQMIVEDKRLLLDLILWAGVSAVLLWKH